MKRVSAGGFTIVETMIVLAVTGVLFLSLVGVVQGRQAKMQYKNSMNDITSTVQSTAGQVASGYYPVSESSFRCVANGGKPQITTLPSTGGIGTNDDCVMLGQAIMFGTGIQNGEHEYKIQTLIGLRQTNAGETPKNFSETKVRVMAPGTADPTTFLPDRELHLHGSQRGIFAGFPIDDTEPDPVAADLGGIPDLSVTKSLQFGTSVKWMRTDDAAGSPVAGFAIVAIPGAQQGGSSAAGLGTVLIGIVPIPCGTIANCEDGLDPAVGVDAIVTAFEGVNGINARPKGVKICFVSASTEQSSLVRIGANGASNGTETVTYNNQDCTPEAGGGPIYAK